MAKTKISEFSSTPANNTDIDSINIAEGCAPSGINDAIRELMAQLKDFQTGAVGDSFNGPIGSSTASTGAFTTLSATGAITSTLATGTAPLVIASTTKVSNLNVDLLDGADWASPAALGSTTPAAVSATTLAASSTVTLSGGTANGVAYLNGSKVVTSGSALTFDGTTLSAIGRLYNGSASTFGASSWAMSLGNGGVSANYFKGDTTYFQNSSGTQIAQLDSTGFGVGTAATYKLDISASSEVVSRFARSGGSNALILISDPTTTTAPYIASYGNNMAFGQYGGSEFGRFTSTGLGIGTSSPAQKLHIKSSGSTKLLINSSDNSADRGVYFASSTDSDVLGYISQEYSTGNFTISAGTGSYAVPMIFRTGGSERMRLDSSGNLGLGVTPSAWGSGYKAIQLLTSSLYGTTSRDINLGANVYVDAVGYKYIQTSFATNYTQYQGAHSWYTAPSGTAGNAITFTQAMTLTAAGRLGIGTTSPAANLEVSSTARLGNFDINVSTADSAVWISGSDFGIGTYYGNAFKFLTNNTERARIDSSGNLGIGTTTPSSRLTVSNSSGGNVASFTNTSSADLNINLTSGVTLLTPSTGTLAFGTSSTERARIDSSGNLLVGTTTQVGKVTVFHSGAFGQDIRYTGGSGTAYPLIFEYGTSTVGSVSSGGTSTAYNTSSDYRLKNSIAPMTGALAKVALLKPCTYKWNADGSDGEGFIAHELAEVCPHAVTGEKDAVDEEGNPKYQGIDTSFLVATLTAAIQELKAEFDAYKASHP